MSLKFTLVEPAGIVTEGGGFRYCEVEERVTLTPPVGATALMVTVTTLLRPDINVLPPVVVIESKAGELTANVPVAVVPFSVAEIVADTLAATDVVVTVKVADELPAGIVTEAGTFAADWFELSETTKPPVGAGPVKTTVPDALVPPVTEFGEMPTPAIADARIFNPPVAVFPFKVPVIVGEVNEATPDVVMLKVAELRPAGTVTVAGTCAAALLELKATEVPPAGETALKVTVPVALVPPIIVPGDTETEDSETPPATINPELTVLLFSVADSVNVVWSPTLEVVIVNVAEVLPAAIVTDAGTWATLLLEASVTTAPPLGAAADSVTVPVLLAPLATELGDEVIVWMEIDEPIPNVSVNVTEP